MHDVDTPKTINVHSHTSLHCSTLIIFGQQGAVIAIMMTSNPQNVVTFITELYTLFSLSTLAIKVCMMLAIHDYDLIPY